MNFLSASEIAQLAAGGAAGLIAIAIFLQKFLTSWYSSRAENSVLTMLHAELDRMGEQNQQLSQELGRLQTEILDLNKQLRTLTQENQKLHLEVSTLTGQVSRLKAALEAQE